MKFSKVLLFSIFIGIMLVNSVFAGMSMFDLTEEQQEVAKQYQEEYNNNQVIRGNYSSQEEYSIAWELAKKDCFDKLSLIANSSTYSAPQFSEFIDVYSPYISYCNYENYLSTLCMDDPSNISNMDYCASPSCITNEDGKEECECLEAKTCQDLELDPKLSITGHCEEIKRMEKNACMERFDEEGKEEEITNKINDLLWEIEANVYDTYNGHECLIKNSVEGRVTTCINDLLDVTTSQVLFAKYSDPNASIEDIIENKDIQKECVINYDSDELYESGFGPFLAICNNSDYARSWAYSCISDNWDDVYSQKNPSKALKKKNQAQDDEKDDDLSPEDIQKALEDQKKEIDEKNEKTINELADELAENFKDLFKDNQELLDIINEEIKEMEDPYDKMKALREAKKEFTKDSKIQKLKDLYLENGGKQEDLDLIVNSSDSIDDLKKSLGKAIIEKGEANSIAADPGLLEDLKSSIGNGLNWTNYITNGVKDTTEVLNTVAIVRKPSDSMKKFYDGYDTTSKAIGWASDAYDNYKFMDKVDNLDIDPNTKDAVKGLRIMGSITKNVASYLPPGLSDGVGALGNSVEVAAEAVTKATKYYNSRAKEAGVVSNSDYRFLQQNLQQYTERSFFSDDVKVKIKIYDPNTSTYYEETGGQMDFKKITTEDGSEAFYSIPKGSTETFDEAEGTGRLYRYHAPWLGKNRLQIYNYTTNGWEDVKVITQKTPVSN